MGLGKGYIKKDRTLETLISNGVAVYNSLLETIESFSDQISGNDKLPKQISIIHTEDLLQEYPDLSPKEREDEAAKKYGAILLIGIGGELSDGKCHDLRAPDYDDWTTKDDNGKPGLNADIIVWDSSRGKSLELSSMGVRVDEEALKLQLIKLGCEDRLSLPFHKQLVNGELPYTIGGGIGKSRVAMFISLNNLIQNVQPIVL